MRELECGTIKWDAILWKYLRPERFINTLETRTMYFASANQFEDDFEGAVAVQMDRSTEDPRYREMEWPEKAFFALKRLTKISCWNCADYESDAMWKLYAMQNKGIAICTTPERMRAAFKPFRLKPDSGVEDMWAAPVTYVDLTQVRMKNTEMLKRFFYKHRAFELEREFRLAISLRQAEEYGVQVPEDGISVEVDLDLLVDRIVLGSSTPPEQRKDIIGRVDHAGLGDRLGRSTLLGHPRYI